MSESQLEAMLRESALPLDEDLRAELAPLRQLVGPVPVPSVELRALFASLEAAPVAAAAPRPSVRVRGRRAVSGALVLALSGVGATGLSAAANTLPAPWQQHVSQFAHRYLPFDLPEPSTTALLPKPSRVPTRAIPEHRAAEPSRDLTGSRVDAAPARAQHRAEVPARTRAEVRVRHDAAPPGPPRGTRPEHVVAQPAAAQPVVAQPADQQEPAPHATTSSHPAPNTEPAGTRGAKGSQPKPDKGAPDGPGSPQDQGSTQDTSPREDQGSAKDTGPGKDQGKDPDHAPGGLPVPAPVPLPVSLPTPAPDPAGPAD